MGWRRRDIGGGVEVTPWYSGIGFRDIRMLVDHRREASGGEKPFWFVAQAFDCSPMKENGHEIPGTGSGVAQVALQEGALEIEGGTLAISLESIETRVYRLAAPQA